MAWKPSLASMLMLALPATTATLCDLPAPPPLYFYRSNGASCSGKEGP